MTQRGKEKGRFSSFLLSSSKASVFNLPQRFSPLSTAKPCQFILAIFVPSVANGTFWDDRIEKKCVLKLQ
jgi:hypothetical protein